MVRGTEGARIDAPAGPDIDFLIQLAIFEVLLVLR